VLGQTEMGKAALCLFALLVSPSSTQLGESGSVYPGFAIMIAIDLQKPYAKLESVTNLALYDID
jgi:hypothetical protein